MVRLSSVVVTAALLPLIVQGTPIEVSTNGYSAFCSPNNALAFALNLPDDGSTDLYFSLSAWSNISWAAVGMGNDQMFNALIFMIYTDASGNNITLSPRLSYSYVEPSYSSDINVTLLPGTGISGGRMLANAVCHGCRSWNGGWISPGNTNAPFIFGRGPLQSFRSNSVTASVIIHAAYGSFTMDLTQAVGPARVPDLPTTNSSGTILDSYSTDKYVMGAVHAYLNFVSMLVIMPCGMAMMHIAKKHVWHSVCETMAAGVALFGFLSGMHCAALYNRTRRYATAHQILGILIMVGVLVEFGLGFKLSRYYVKRLPTRRFTTTHVWLGRLVVVSAVINGFLGHRLSYRMDYSWSYFAVVTIGLFIYSLVRPCKWLWKYFKSPVLVWYARVRAWCVRTRVRARALVITLLEDMQRTERQRQHETLRRHIESLRGSETIALRRRERR